LKSEEAEHTQTRALAARLLEYHNQPAVAVEVPTESMRKTAALVEAPAVQPDSRELVFQEKDLMAALAAARLALQLLPVAAAAVVEQWEQTLLVI
jgi:hypothetical protein